jgi:hypothetical protein
VILRINTDYFESDKVLLDYVSIFNPADEDSTLL